MSDVFCQFLLENKTWNTLDITNVNSDVVGVIEINSICYVICRKGITKLPSTQYFCKFPSGMDISKACQFKDQVLLFDKFKNNILFNPINRKLSDTNIRTKIVHFDAAEFLNKVWIVGGWGSDDAGDYKTFNTIQVYDPVSKVMSFSPIKLVQARCGHKAIVYNEKLFVFGGYGRSSGHLNTVEMYSPDTKKFIIMAPMKIARKHFACCRVGNLVYIISGSVDRWNNTTSVEIYNLDKDTWTDGENFPFSEYGLPACTISKKLNNIDLIPKSNLSL